MKIRGTLQEGKWSVIRQAFKVMTQEQLVALVDKSLEMSEDGARLTNELVANEIIRRADAGLLKGSIREQGEWRQAAVEVLQEIVR